MKLSKRGIRQGQLTLLPLVMCIFFAVSGGPFGLETLVSSSGPGMALLLIAFIPLIWSMPAALMTAELTSALPKEGGYYVWVKEGLGPFAGFLCGWWSWVYSWVDLSIYPGLFAKYLVAFLAQAPAMAVIAPNAHHTETAIGVVMIVALTLLNIKGVKIAGTSNVGLAVLLLAPFLAMVVLGFAKFVSNPHNLLIPVTVNGMSPRDSLTAGLFVILWNYLAWDSLSTVAGETVSASSTFPRALMWSIPLVIAAYLLPFLAGLQAQTNPAAWVEGSWPRIAAAVGGPSLGLAVAAAAVLSVLGMFNATLLAGSRVPFVLAEDGFLPKTVAKVHSKTGTPWVAILISAAAAGVLAHWNFDVLVKIDVLIYSAGLVLEFAALLALRLNRPKLPRPYRIPGGSPMLAVIVAVPCALVAWASVALLQNDRGALVMTLIALATGPLIYGVRLLATSR